jgi:hypothetical protein
MNTNGINKSLSAFLVAWLACGIMEVCAAEDNVDQNKQMLSERIQRQIRSLDVNHAEKFLVDLNFSTFHGMYAYRELLQWARALPENSEARQDVLIIVRSGMEAVVRDSGMGVPLSGWNGEGQPVGMLFGEGLPRYNEYPDFSKPQTLKWVDTSFRKLVAPESIGQSLAAKSLFILTDATPEGKKLANILLPSVLQEFQTLTALLELGGGKNLANIPLLFRLNDKKWEVANENGNIYGRMSLLQGLVQLHALLSDPVAGSGSVAGKRIADWRKEVRQTMERVYDVSVKQNFDAQAGSYLSDYDRGKGAGDRLSTDDAGYIMEVLANLVDSLPKGDTLRESALKNLISQANYVVARLEEKNQAPKMFLVKKNAVSQSMFVVLSDQLALVGGLLAAERATGKGDYGKPALAIFNNAHKELWSVPAGVFRSATGQRASGYDGRLFGLNLAVWRQLEKSPAIQDAKQNAANLIQAVLKKAGLLQAEGPAGGETKQPEEFFRDDLPQLVNDIAALKSEERSAKILAVIKTLADQNNDGVPGCRFGGGRFGGAPVLIAQTSVKTPFDSEQIGAAAPASAVAPTGTTAPTSTTAPRRTP